MPQTHIITSDNTPQYLKDEYQELVGRAKEESLIPYTPYADSRQADFTQDQLDAFAATRAQQGLGQELLNEGTEMVRNAMVAPSQAGLEPYMNPYADLVTQHTLDELERRNQIAAQGDAAAAVRAGAFGGSRFGVVEAERARNHERNMAEVLGQANAANYEQALNQYNRQQELQYTGGQAMGGLGAQMQGMNIADANALLGVGGLQQMHDQDAYDLAYQDFQRQLQYPKEQIGFLHNILQGDAYKTEATTQTRDAPDPSSSSQWANVALQGLSFLGNNPGVVSGAYNGARSLWNSFNRT